MNTQTHVNHCLESTFLHSFIMFLFIFTCFALFVFSMDLLMAITKPMRSGRGQENCPRASLLSGWCICACAFVADFTITIKLFFLNMHHTFFRFEMPYNIWCDGCKNHIGMGECEGNIDLFSDSNKNLFIIVLQHVGFFFCSGVRYNAEKKKVGMYYTTPIYR